MMDSFIFGGKGQPKTPKEIEHQRAIAAAIMARGGTPKNIGEGLTALGDGLVAGVMNNRARAGEEEGQAGGKSLYADILAGLTGGQSASPQPPTSGAVPSYGGGQRDASTSTFDSSVATPFLDTLRSGGITNPNALAAVGATGQRESGWDPKNLNRSWSDPSESGAAGQAGGALSWRAERLDKLRAFAAANGEQGNGSPATQARFFMQEDPALVARLNAAKSPEEAMQHMNGAWRFAGYDRPGGEAAARIAEAQKWAARNPLANTPPMQPGQSPTNAAPEQGNTSQFWRNTPSPADNPQALGPDVAPAAPPAMMPTAPVAQQAQAVQPQSQMQPPAAAQAPPSANIARLSAAISHPSFAFLPAAQQGVVKSLLEQEIKKADPRYQLEMEGLRNQQQLAPMQRRALELGNQKSERELDRVDTETMTAPDGTVFEREKGKAGAQWQQSIKLPQKPAEATTDQRELDQINRERQNASLPALRMDEWKLQKGRASAPAVNIDQKQESEFGKKTGEALAKRFDSFASEGDEAVQNQVLVDEMRRLGGKVQTGASAAFTKRLSDIGIKLDGASEVEAYSALIDRMTPQQRVPGSGATSDFDAKMFKGSLPTLMNTPGGNAIIIDTMDKLNANKMARGDIAMRVQMGDLNPKQGLDEIRKLQIEARALSDQFKSSDKATTAPPAQGQAPNRTKSGVTWSVE